jgi:transposase
MVLYCPQKRREKMEQFNSEFKLLVAKKAMEARTFAEVAREYDVSVCNVKRWMLDYKKFGDTAFEKDGPELRIRDLERQIADLEEENAILKKAAAIFSKQK